MPSADVTGDSMIMADQVLTGHSLADENGRLLAVDDGVCEIMQRSERELLGTLYSQLTFTDDLANNVAIVQKTRSGARPVTIRKRYVRPDQSLVWSNVQVSRLNTGIDKGRLIGTLCLTHDDHCPQRLWRSARATLASIEQRRTALGKELFFDYAWLVLLQSYLAEAEGGLLDLGACGDRVGMSVSLLNRWVDVLAQRGFVERFGSAVQLTHCGSTKVESLLAGQPAPVPR
jgi:PAS domain S-box-containing protein